MTSEEYWLEVKEELLKLDDVQKQGESLKKRGKCLSFLIRKILP